MIIKAYKNGTGYSIGDEFKHDNCLWYIVALRVDKNDALQSFDAITFNQDEVTQDIFYANEDLDSCLLFTGVNKKAVYNFVKEMTSNGKEN